MSVSTLHGRLRGPNAMTGWGHLQRGSNYCTMIADAESYLSRYHAVWADAPVLTFCPDPNSILHALADRREAQSAGGDRVQRTVVGVARGRDPRPQLAGTCIFLLASELRQGPDEGEHTKAFSPARLAYGLRGRCGLACCGQRP